MAHYPADTFQEATEIAIEASNQLHGVINGDANAEVTVEDGSKIPSVRKAMVDSLYFKPPIAWAQGEYEDTYNQLREFVDGDVRTWWFAKGATVSTPVLMTTNPATDVNWTLWSAVTLNAATYKTQKRLAAEAGLNMVGSFLLGGTVTNVGDVVFCETDGKYYGWGGTLPKTVPAGSTPATSGGMGAGTWVDRTDLTLRSEINIVQKRFACVADMVADTSLYVGQIIETLGYYSGSFLGSNRYKIVLAGTGVSDGGSFLTLVNSLQAEGLFPLEAPNNYQFGSKGDGITDDSASIQKLFNFARHSIVKKGSYLLDGNYTDAYNGLVIPSDSLIDVESGTIFTVKTNSTTHYSAFSFLNSSNLVFNGNKCKVVGDRLTHIGSTGEWGFGLQISSSHNVVVNDVDVSNFWGDGLIIGEYGGSGVYSYDITMNRITSDNSRRNGLSIVSAHDCIFNSCKFTNTNGTAPQCGLDSEPNAGKPQNYNCIFNKCDFSGNTGGGINGAYANGSSGFTFNDCTGTAIAGASPIVNFKSDGANGWSKFNRCNFKGTILFTDYCSFDTTSFYSDSSNTASVYTFGNDSDTPLSLNNCVVESDGINRPAGFLNSTSELSRKHIRNTKFIKNNDAGSNIALNVSGKVTFTDCDLVQRGAAPASAFYFNGVIDGIDICVTNMHSTQYFTIGGVYNTSYGSSIIKGSGAPEGVVSARIGSLYVRYDGGASTTLYVKQSGTGNTGWVAK